MAKIKITGKKETKKPWKGHYRSDPEGGGTTGGGGSDGIIKPPDNRPSRTKKSKKG